MVLRYGRAPETYYILVVLIVNFIYNRRSLPIKWGLQVSYFLAYCSDTFDFTFNSIRKLKIIRYFLKYSNILTI